MYESKPAAEVGGWAPASTFGQATHNSYSVLRAEHIVAEKIVTLLRKVVLGS